MSYLETLLGPGERPRFTARLHPVDLALRLSARLAQLLLVLIGLRIAGSALVDRIVTSDLLRELGPGGGPLPVARWAGYAGLLLVVAIVASAALDYGRWRETCCALTDQRVIHLQGVLQRTSLDVPVDAIEDLRLVQTWLGQRLDYGDLELGSVRAGADLGTMQRVAAPIPFKHAIWAARDRRRSVPAIGAAAAASGPGSSPSRSERRKLAADALRDLRRLREEGLLRSDEFEEKKRELLASLGGGRSED